MNVGSKATGAAVPIGGTVAGGTASVVDYTAPGPAGTGALTLDATASGATPARA